MPDWAMIRFVSFAVFVFAFITATLTWRRYRSVAAVLWFVMVGSAAAAGYSVIRGNGGTPPPNEILGAPGGPIVIQPSDRVPKPGRVLPAQLNPPPPARAIETSRHIEATMRYCRTLSDRDPVRCDFTLESTSPGEVSATIHDHKSVAVDTRGVEHDADSVGLGDNLRGTQATYRIRKGTPLAGQVTFTQNHNTVPDTFSFVRVEFSVSGGEFLIEFDNIPILRPKS